MTNFLYWRTEGRIETLEILQDYKDYRGFNEVYEAWKRLPKEEKAE